MNFELQHKDDITRQNLFNITIIHALKNTYENCSHFRRSVDTHLCQSMSVFL